MYIGKDPARGRPIQVSPPSRAPKKHARTSLAEFVADVTDVSVPLERSTTLGHYLERWLAHIAVNRSPTTVRGYGDKTKRIKAKPGQIQLAKLSPHTLDRVYGEWLEEGLSFRRGPRRAGDSMAILSSSSNPCPSPYTRLAREPSGGSAAHLDQAVSIRSTRRTARRRPMTPRAIK